MSQTIINMEDWARKAMAEISVQAIHKKLSTTKPLRYTFYHGGIKWVLVGAPKFANNSGWKDLHFEMTIHTGYYIQEVWPEYIVQFAKWGIGGLAPPKIVLLRQSEGKLGHEYVCTLEGYPELQKFHKLTNRSS